nr:hypothetical protein [Lachnospiraceae bacterium]
MWKIIVIALCACAAFYLLYINGWMIINAKRAVMYIGSRRGNQATFSSCTGYIKRVVRFRESRTYHFTFEPELSAGEVI